VKKKEGIVTFKVGQDLYDTIKDMPNRSEFIRTAILNALGNTCPLCNGTGVLSQNQWQHWNHFVQSHEIKSCEECHERMLVCMAEPVAETPEPALSEQETAAGPTAADEGSQG
jgi:hypothetical protein